MPKDSTQYEPKQQPPYKKKMKNAWKKIRLKFPEGLLKGSMGKKIPENSEGRG